MTKQPTPWVLSILVGTATSLLGCATTENRQFSLGTVRNAAEVVGVSPRADGWLANGTPGQSEVSQDAAAENQRNDQLQPSQAGSLEVQHRVQPASGEYSLSTNSIPSVVMPAARLHAMGGTTVSGDAPEMVTSLATHPLDIGEAVQLNLPSVLAAIDGRHPIVGFAQWRVREAYAELDQAKAQWLPTIQAGFGFHRHDGNYQASNGQIVDVNRNSFQYGLGVGAVGAGTTPRPGLVAQFHLADALFQPKVAQKQAWADGHGAVAVRNRQMLEAGAAYYTLLQAYQDHHILQQSSQRLDNLAKITIDFAEAGEGLDADAQRMRAERSLVRTRAVLAMQQVDVSSSRLARAISLDGQPRIMPLDPAIVPVELHGMDDKQWLIATALQTRPELKRSQALVAAACEAYRREEVAPMLPSVLLGMSTGGFGGGLGGQLSNVDDRYDLDAQLAWQFRNLGRGEQAARLQRRAQVQQARFEKLQVMDQVANEVAESLAECIHQRQLVDITAQAIETAQLSFDANLERIREGQGLPIEVLQSALSLESAQQANLQAIIAHNQAQLRLKWAMGWSVM